MPQSQTVLPGSVPGFAPIGGLMGVLELCDVPAASVLLEATAGDAVRLMLDRHVGAVAVVDGEKRVAGIFTERDVLIKLALSQGDLDNTPVCEVMTTPVELASADTTPGEALTTMVDRHFRHLPVADYHGRLLGMLSIRDVLQWRIDDLGQELDSLEQYVSNDGPGG